MYLIIYKNKGATFVKEWKFSVIERIVRSERAIYKNYFVDNLNHIKN